MKVVSRHKTLEKFAGDTSGFTTCLLSSLKVARWSALWKRCIPMLQVRSLSVVHEHAIQALRAICVLSMLATAAGTPSK